MEEKCANILDKFPWITSERDASGAKNKPNQIQMGTMVLGKGPKSNSRTAESKSNCSSTSPLNPIGENGQIVDMEEEMPELVDETENDDSGTSGDQQSQPLITFGQAHLNDIEATIENLGQSINVTFEVDNGNSRNTPPNPHILLRDVSQEQSQGDKLVALSDKL